MRLTGRRVTLRSFHEGELGTMMAARQRGDGSDRDPSTVSEQMLRRRVERSGTLTRHEMLMAVDVDGRLVGEIQARRSIEALPPGVFELGVEIYMESDRGCGYASDAVSVLTSHLFEEVGAHRVQASTDVANAAMRRVLERLGFGFEGVLRGFMPTSAGPRDYAMYGVRASDWARRSQPARAEVVER